MNSTKKIVESVLTNFEDSDSQGFLVSMNPEIKRILLKERLGTLLAIISTYEEDGTMKQGLEDALEKIKGCEVHFLHPIYNLTITMVSTKLVAAAPLPVL